MHRVLKASGCGVVGFILGVAFHGSALHVSAVGTPTAAQNGDTNGDGVIDISDAVYLLGFLFTGGPSLATIDCPPPQPRSILPATGQTTCFGTASVIDCTNVRARGQDAFHELGCPLEGRFVDNGDGTVSDNCTGLMWTKRNVDVDNDGEIIIRSYGDPSADELEWLAACQFADDMTYLGHEDWRVPNVNELLSIMTFSQSNASNAHFYPPFEFERTWTSTHLNTSRSLGYRLLTAGFNCDCCALMYSEHSQEQVFVAVRGPVATP